MGSIQNSSYGQATPANRIPIQFRRYDEFYFFMPKNSVKQRASVPDAPGDDVIRSCFNGPVPTNYSLLTVFNNLRHSKIKLIAFLNLKAAVERGKAVQAIDVHRE